MDNSNRDTMRYISISGQIGSGKGTLAEGLTRSIPNSQAISYGEIYRNARDNKEGYQHLHEVIAPYIEDVDNGVLLPDEPTMQLIQHGINQAKSEGKKTIILDGFPRTLEQLYMFQDYASSDKTDFINIELNDEEARERATMRMVNNMAQEGTFRKDDQSSRFKRRLENYPKFTQPVIDLLKSTGRLTLIDGTKPQEEVLKEALSAVNSEEGQAEVNEARRFAIILAGGKGTRMDPDGTSQTPKSMREIGPKPLLEWQIDQLRKADITDVIISEGHLANVIQDYFGDGKSGVKDFGVNINHYIDPASETQGTAGAVKHALQQLPDGVDESLVMWGDIFTNADLSRLATANKDALVTLMGVKDEVGVGVLDMNERGIVTGFLQKPLANSAIFSVKKKLADNLPDEGDFSLTLEKLVKTRQLPEGSVRGIVADGTWLHVGDKESLGKARESVKPVFRGRESIG